jgi:hypothetical protein
MTSSKPNKDEKLQIRLTKTELEKLRRYADMRGLSSSEAVRNWIRRLPNEHKKPPEITLPGGLRIVRQFDSTSKVIVPNPLE